MSRARNRKAWAPSVESLLELSQDLPLFSLVGFELRRQTVKVHLGSVPPDERSGVAGLFGIRAPKSWYAIGITVGGTARRVESPDVTGTAVSAVILTRAGDMASCLDIDGERLLEDSTNPTGMDSNRYLPAEGPQGCIVDSLHRILGLPSPGPEVDPASLVTGLWFEDIFNMMLATGSISWTEVARIHPLAGDNPLIPPSSEMIIEATCRASTQIDWERLRCKALLRGEPSAGLTPSELRWMDATMFSRWVLSSFPDVGNVIELMHDFGCGEAAERLSYVVGEIHARQTPPPISDHRDRTA